MKLVQGQIWKKDESYIRIVERDRQSVTFKTLDHPEAGLGELATLSKKEFCRLLKGAELQAKPL